MKTAIYLRVSTNYQDTGLEAQEKALLDYCKIKGHKSCETFSDVGISGAKHSRPSLDKMMKLVRTGEINTVIVYSFSRFARSTTHLLETLNEFNKLGVEFISVSEQVDTSTAMGKLVFTFISALAEFERELISERVKNGLQNAKDKGKKLGRPKTRNSELIRSLLDKGFSYRQIARIAKCSHWSIAEELKLMRTEKG